MREAKVPLRIKATGLLAVFAAMLASFSTDCSAKTYLNCVGLCENILPCNDTYDDCLSSCTSLENRCDRVGQPSVFSSYLQCVIDAGFSCTEAGSPVANAPCGPQQAQLVQCAPPEGGPDAPLAVPDGSYDAAFNCLEAGSCLACCSDAYPKGAKKYRELTTACVCGSGCTCPNPNPDGGPIACATECAMAVCATPAMQPTPGGRCDSCLAAALNAQNPDVGPCVEGVARQCTGNVECALYLNCVSQSGCTN